MATSPSHAAPPVQNDSLVVTVNFGSERGSESERRRVIVRDPSGVARQVSASAFDTFGDTLSLTLPAVIRFARLPGEMTVAVPASDAPLRVTFEIHRPGDAGSVTCTGEGRFFEHHALPNGGGAHRVDSARPLSCAARQ
jgi:hypothetical protein